MRLYEFVYAMGRAHGMFGVEPRLCTLNPQRYTVLRAEAIAASPTDNFGRHGEPFTIFGCVVGVNQGVRQDSAIFEVGYCRVSFYVRELDGLGRPGAGADLCAAAG